MKLLKQYKRQTRKSFQHRSSILGLVITITDVHHLIDKLTDQPQLIKEVIFSTEKRPDSTLWVGGVKSALNTDPLFTIHDCINNIFFVIATGSAVSLK